VVREIRTTLVAWLPVPLALLAYWFFSKTSTQFSRIALSFWFVLAPAMLCAMRAAIRIGLRILHAQGCGTRQVAILGCTKDAERVAEALERQPWLGLKLRGIYDDRSEKRRHLPENPRFKVLGTSADLTELCRQGLIDVVYIALPLRAEQRTTTILAGLADTTVTVYMVADFLCYSLLHAQWSHVGSIPVVGMHNTPFEGIVAWVKRLEDLALGSLIVLITLIPMALIAKALPSGTMRSSGPPLSLWRSLPASSQVPSATRSLSLPYSPPGQVGSWSHRSSSDVGGCAPFACRPAGTGSLGIWSGFTLSSVMTCMGPPRLHSDQPL
jgi:putative colanic acid biosynthesis UDP-glucose lipid carrier transferase